jgi:UDP-N-acetylmuramoyl-tripeptide--D-alanyl-D-alanine ligase
MSAMGGDIGAAAMMDLVEAGRALGGALEGPNARFSGVTTDSRAVSAGDLFVALAGERFDGHAYVEEAVRRGAAAALTSRRIEARSSRSRAATARRR